MSPALLPPPLPSEPEILVFPTPSLLLQQHINHTVISDTLSPSCQGTLSAPVLLLQHVLTDATFLLLQGSWGSTGRQEQEEGRKLLCLGSKGTSAWLL